MSPHTQMQIAPVKPPPRWKTGIDRKQVAVYVGLALMAGFAFGFATAKYLTQTAPISSPALIDKESVLKEAIRKEAAQMEGAKAARDATARDATALAADSPREGRVTRILRADTIEVETIGPVKMIGVETPDGREPREIYAAHGRNALAFTEKSLLARRVRLEFDPAFASNQNRNDAGQALAYVYTEEDALFNAELIEQGYAIARFTQPLRLAELLRSAEREAMQAMRGIWGAAGSAAAVAADAQSDRSKKLTPLLPSEIGPDAGSGAARADSSSSTEQTVYLSPADRMYHRAGCEYLGNKRQAASLAQARSKGHTACSRCFASTVMRAR